MTKKELFDIENLELFMPNDGVEFIYSVLGSLGFHDYTTKKAKEKGMAAISMMFELKFFIGEMTRGYLKI